MEPSLGGVAAAPSQALGSAGWTSEPLAVQHRSLLKTCPWIYFSGNREKKPIKTSTRSIRLTFPLFLIPFCPPPPYFPLPPARLQVYYLPLSALADAPAVRPPSAGAARLLAIDPGVLSRCLANCLPPPFHSVSPPSLAVFSPTSFLTELAGEHGRLPPHDGFASVPIEERSC